MNVARTGEQADEPDGKGNLKPLSSLRTFAMNNSERKIQNLRAASRRSCEAPQADGSMRFFRMHQFWELADGLTRRSGPTSER